ncbi:MAG: glycosyltransferase family 39 protein [Solirubrobacteraceae bacterium]
MGTSVEPGSRALADPESAAHSAQLPAGSRLRRPGTVVIALMLGAAALRFATLNVQSIWLDESATMILVRRGFSGMLSHLPSSESAPPLYYILVWAWTRLFGAGPLGFRSCSALVGVLTIPVVYAAGRRISTRTGLWAAALTAVNPAMYYYSQEARAYALVVLLSAAALVLWQRALEAPSRRGLWLWAGMSSLAVLTHYFAAFLFLPEAAILARRLGWRRTLPPSTAVALVGIALAPLALRERADGKSNWIEAASLASRIGESAKQFLVGLYGPLEILSALLAALLAAGALALLLRYGDRRERHSARDFAMLAGAAILLPLLLAVTHLVDVFDGRNMIAAWAPCAVLVAIGLGVARAPRAGAALGVGLCAVSLAVIAGIDTTPGYQRDDWRGAAQALPALRHERVIVGQENASLPLSIYLPATREATGASVSTGELDFIALRTRRTGRAPLPPVVPTSPPHGFRLAGVSRSEAFAVARFLAPHATSVQVATLRRIGGEPKAEVIVQR